MSLMKRLIYLSICICLLLGITACKKNYLPDNKPINLENMKVEEKYYPKFMNIDKFRRTI